MKRGHSLFPLILAALLAGTTFWLEHFVRTQAPTPDGKNRHDPDMVAHNAVQTRFDLTGKRQYTLRARELVHYPDRDTTEAHEAQLDHFGRPPAAHLTADTAIILANGSEVHLIGNVHARREPAPGIPETTFATNTLTVWPDSERAETPDPVHMTRGRAIIDGVGLVTDQINGTTQIDKGHAILLPLPKENRK